MWNEFQLKIFDDVANGTGHTVVQARAGTGKTTTIMEALKHVPAGKTVLMAAFNKSIATELAARVAKGSFASKIDVKTLHGHGFAAVRRAFKNVTVDENKTRMLAERLFGPQDHNQAFNYAALQRLVSVAKDTLIDAGDRGALDAAADIFQIDLPEDKDPIKTDALREEFIRRAARLLLASQAETSIIDFSDMCWLPIVLDLRPWQYDRVFIDETQDLSPSQIELALKCVRRGGRICAVGDDRQAIYGFRGADEQAMPKLINRLLAKVLPLSVTYRCGKTIVAMAKAIVADYECPATAPEGRVLPSTYEQLEAEASIGDMVISRANAPLLRLCLAFLKQRKRAAIKGREIGEGLIALIKKSEASSIKELETWIHAWANKESERLAKRERDPQEAFDKRDCVLLLCEDAKDVNDAILQAQTLFTNGDAADRITLGTTHKLKGLEADRVWMLTDTYKGRGTEADNLRYVAITRAKTELRLVDKAFVAPSAEKVQ